MINIKEITKSYSETIVRLVAMTSSLLLIVSWLGKLYTGVFPGLISVLQRNSNLLIWIIVISLFLYLLMRVKRLSDKLTLGFQDRFKEPLNKNWDFVGDWKIEEGNELSVSGSDTGGITKVGSLWENYTYEFETKILNRCTSWVVRATDLDNYVMFQCTDKVIRPHLRIKFPELTSVTMEGKATFVYKVGWVVDTPPFNSQPHNKSLDGWFRIKTAVKGTRVDIYINGDNVFHQDNLLSIPIGKVGFRNAGDEHAHFRNVKVTMN